MPLAALGVASIEVYQKPRVAFISTGKELVDDLSLSLQSGQIYNCNRPYSILALTELGCDVVASYTIPDDVASFDRLLKDLLTQNLDFIVSSGAVSAGDFDFVRSSLEQNGADILYHKVLIKPGKPNLFAQFPNGIVYFGLPGNPVATAVGIRFFVSPFVRAMLELEEEQGLSVKISSAYSKKTPLRLFQKALLSYSDEGELSVSIMEGQESFMLHPFLKMNAWAIIPEESDCIKQGEKVEVFPISSYIITV
jgi:molybdopterin molybdotransferase